MVRRELTDEAWSKIEPFLTDKKPSSKGGRKFKPKRECFEGILWILRTGARWKDLPDCFPSPSTCWRRLERWEENGDWERAWHAFLDQLGQRDKRMWEEVFADATFVPAKKGVIASVKPSAAKARSWLWWAAARAFLWHKPSTRQARRQSN
ncbi:MAG TPA: transposase [Terriglobia bacterium]|nr:transposase [Terriglobia bacterium]